MQLQNYLNITIICDGKGKLESKIIYGAAFSIGYKLFLSCSLFTFAF